MRLNNSLKLCMVLMLILSSSLIFAQEKTITGKIIDEGGIPLPGVTIIEKGTANGAVTDFDGNYSIKVIQQNATLVFSYIGMASQEIPIAGKSEISVTMLSTAEALDDIVIIGYGAQKKESIVGAISVAKGEDLMKAGGVTNVGEALQGRLPGVVSIASSGQPGSTDPNIFIRGQSSWNGGGQPLILVDGIERQLGDIDINEIDQLSVLKDASATAVFGVKGANGVILITTKRGKTGKAQLTLSGNVTIKAVSKLPTALESYDAVLLGNESILREVAISAGSWSQIVPFEIADKYRNPASIEESYIYPNVDWQDVILKDQVTDTRVNLSVRGGSDFAKYFGSLSFQTTRDIFKGDEYDNGKGYSSEYKYDRFNYRSNLDFNISETTKLSVNLSGYFGTQEIPDGQIRNIAAALYDRSPALYTPIYPDGLYGLDPAQLFANPLVNLTQSGYTTDNRISVNTDFILEQKLDFITEGLKVGGRLSFDNLLIASRSVNDPLVTSIRNVEYRIYDENGNESIFSGNGVNDFDYVVQPWNRTPSGIIDNGSRGVQRRLTYRFTLDYNKKIAEKHNITTLLLFQREEYARGSEFPRLREDWVGRVTYNYDNKYFLDVNGAYNGSEKFGPDFRFDLFPSAAVGWMVSNENFLKNSSWLDKLKIRGSYGLVGDDNSSGRFRYLSQWGSGGNAYINSDFNSRSPYTWFSEEVVGNPTLQWETALKTNIGFELGLFKNKLTAEVDYFTEDRDNIFIQGSDRTVPQLFGTAPPDGNTGSVEVRGYEVVLGYRHDFASGVNLWSDFNFTSAIDKVISREDPILRPDYQKAAGFPIGQPRAPIAGDILGSWDDIYGATPTTNDQGFRRPGYYDLVDFNNDGTFDATTDNAPTGYTSRPQKTWTYTLGGGYKGFNVMVMFYGAFNATRQFRTRAFQRQTPIYFEHLSNYWSPENQNTDLTLRPWSVEGGADDPQIDLFDASLVRLRTVELSYNIPKTFCKKMGISGLKLFVNGNNLALWTNMPDDREFNGSIEADFRGDYPTLKRFNLGLNLNF